MRYFNVMILGPSQSPYEGEESFPLVLLFCILIALDIMYMFLIDNMVLLIGFGNSRWNLDYWKILFHTIQKEQTLVK